VTLSPARTRPGVRRRLALLGAAACAALALTSMPATEATPVRPAALTPVSATRTLLWSDEFNTSTPWARPDPARWLPDVGGHGWGNQQLEYDTRDAANAHLSGNGILAIAAMRRANPYTCWYGPCTYTSARLTTRNRFTARYGTLEARMQIPCGTGLWPAFWALGSNVGTVGWPDSGEIDVMENIGSEPNTVHGTIHGPGYSGDFALSGLKTVSTPLCQAYHLYTSTWSPAAITFALDGVTYATVTKAQVGTHPWVFDHSFYLLVNLAVGGNWPGSPTSSTAFSALLKIDYVRVYAPA
jgi:beta-glucanase (GH16 family)